MALKSKKRPRSSSAAAAADWASLPEEILDLILNRLIQHSDFLRFSAVCKSWLSAAANQKHHRRREVHRQIPLLLITPPPTADQIPAEADDDRRNLYSVRAKKVLNLNLRVPYRRRFCGSSYGWLAGVNREKYLSITLFNPFSRKSLRFPRLENSSFCCLNIGDLYSNQYETLVDKVVLSCDPSLMPNDFVVLAIYSDRENLAYIKPGQKDWTYVVTFMERVNFYLDAAYHQGKFYVLTSHCGLLSVDVSKTTPQVKVVVAFPTPFRTGDYASKSYIVVSSSGADLLLVQRFRKEERRRPRRWTTSHFKIFKLLGLASGEQVAEKVETNRLGDEVEIKCLGDDSLFLGDSFCQSVSASNLPGCRPNCVYYADDYTDRLVGDGREDRGIYSLEHGSLAPHYRLKTRRQRLMYTLPAQWIVPPLL